ncbi:integrase core domain-containing protein [Streptomyces sp. NPDC096057]|uniref:integrase core domain-containing protein n=1 Tax=Streptomyces sp. NPDC096057 TaxID=3155543 RepID=UPI00331B137E
MEDALSAAQILERLSVGRTGQCWDNALAESFFATIKRELLDTTAWPSRASAHTARVDAFSAGGIGRFIGSGA